MGIMNWFQRRREVQRALEEKRKNALERRKQVENDQKYYCQDCGKRNASLVSGYTFQDGAFCSDSCRFFYDKKTGGIEDALLRSRSMMGVLAFDSQNPASVKEAVLALRRMDPEQSFMNDVIEKHCIWCGQILKIKNEKCFLCDGLQEKKIIK